MGNVRTDIVALKREVLRLTLAIAAQHDREKRRFGKATKAIVEHGRKLAALDEKPVKLVACGICAAAIPTGLREEHLGWHMMQGEPAHKKPASHALFCEHANEVPCVCRCDKDCWCRRTRQCPDISFRPAARHPERIGGVGDDGCMCAIQVGDCPVHYPKPAKVRARKQMKQILSKVRRARG